MIQAKFWRFSDWLPDLECATILVESVQTG